VWKIDRLWRSLASTRQSTTTQEGERVLTNKRLKDFVVRATDGELGTVDQLYFDDES
jgi:hypothetical protein